MKVKYYKDDDILIIKTSDKPIDYAEENDDIVVHFDEKKNQCGLRFWTRADF